MSAATTRKVRDRRDLKRHWMRRRTRCRLSGADQAFGQQRRNAKNCPILLKNGRVTGYNCVVFANLDGWGAVDDGGAASRTRRVVLRVLARTTCAGKAPAASD